MIRHCPRCGEEVTEYDIVCPYCGGGITFATPTEDFESNLKTLNQMMMLITQHILVIKTKLYVKIKKCSYNLGFL